MQAVQIKNSILMTLQQLNSIGFTEVLLAFLGIKLLI